MLLYAISPVLYLNDPVTGRFLGGFAVGIWSIVIRMFHFHEAWMHFFFG